MPFTPGAFLLEWASDAQNTLVFMREPNHVATSRILRQNLSMRRVCTLGLVMALTLVLTGCGESSQIYPASKENGVFFAVPKNWNSLSYAALSKYEKSSANKTDNSRESLVRWQVAYSLDPKIKVSSVFTLKPPSSPLIFARVRDLTSEETNDFSYNSLRDVIVPITQLASGTDLGVNDFEILNDREVVEKGARGVQTIYRFTLQGEQQTFNQTALMSDDRSVLYILIGRCTTTCYKKNKKEIEKIVSSFTVQGAK